MGVVVKPRRLLQAGDAITFFLSGILLAFIWPYTHLIFYITLAVVSGITTYIYSLSGIYRFNWKFLSLIHFRRMAIIELFTSGLLAGYVIWTKPHIWVLFPIGLFLLARFFLLLIHRIFWLFRLNPEYRIKKQGEYPIIIYGAGTVAMHLLHDISHEDILAKYHIAAFVDNNMEKAGGHIGPYKIHAGSELNNLVRKHHVREIWFTMPVKPVFLQSVLDDLKNFKIIYKVVPRKIEALLPDIRDLKIEDLISRPEIKLDENVIRKTIEGKRVLVTGAAGSIGREIARQASACNPSRLTLADQWEEGVYNLNRQFAENDKVYCCITDVRDSARIAQLILEEKPQVIFHTAALKHVPLMEIHYAEAIRTNILGTYHLLQAIENTIEQVPGSRIQLVCISTDKAVSPENIMGLTKRIAELLVYNVSSKYQDSEKLKAISVRFGNVLGSSGSVVPLFWEQIQKGGPVTVTHPEMERFFMNIPEAVRLVITALSVSEGKEILALDMGRPVKITDLAERLIRLAGKQPGTEIEILFSGVRPGEKLKEELFWEKDTIQTSVPFIFSSKGDLKKMNVSEFIILLKESLQNTNSLQWWKSFLSRFV